MLLLFLLLLLFWLLSVVRRHLFVLSVSVQRRQNETSAHTLFLLVEALTIRTITKTYSKTSIETYDERTRECDTTVNCRNRVLENRKNAQKSNNNSNESDFGWSYSFDSKLIDEHTNKKPSEKNKFAHCLLFRLDFCYRLPSLNRWYWTHEIQMQKHNQKQLHWAHSEATKRNHGLSLTKNKFTMREKKI